MNQLSKGLLGLLLCLTTAISYAQPADINPYKFSKLPEESIISPSTLAAAFQYQTGEKVSIPLSDQFIFEGVVISNEQKYDNLQNIILRSEDHVMLSISKQTEKGKRVSYTGRVIGKDIADGFSIQRSADVYLLKKFSKENILQDCTF